MRKTKETELNLRTRADVITDAINLTLMIVVLVIVLYPLYLILIASVSDAYKVVRGEVWLYPKGFSLDAYQHVFMNNELWRSYANSIGYTVTGALISLILTMAGAYALTKNFPGKQIVSFMIVFTMFFNGGLIPTFLTIKQVGLYNTPWIMVLMNCVTVWNLMLARTYISSSIPHELYEAATLDGADHFTYFIRVVLPLSSTIIAVLSVYYGIARWNDYFTGLIYISDRQWLPLQTLLKEILAALQVSDSTLAMVTDDAASRAEALKRAEVAKYCIIVISTVPAIVLYLFMQKFFVKGVMIGSLKG